MTEPSRLLFITLSNIGDAVMTTPVLTTLHALFPAAAIDIVADARSAELFETCPFRGDIFLKNKKEGWRGVLRLVRALRQRHYDVIVDLRTDGLSWLLRGARRFTKRDARNQGGHAVQRALAVIASLTTRPPPPTQLWLREADRTLARSRTASLPRGRWLAVAPGANWPPKTWPVDHFRTMLQHLAGDVDGLILLGSAQDRAACTMLQQSTGLPALNAAGETSLQQAAALLELATLFVGNDSGLGHIASAVGTLTLTLFGPGDANRYHPWGEKARWLAAEDGRIDSLSPTLVAAEVENMLSTSKHRTA